MSDSDQALSGYLPADVLPGPSGGLWLRWCEMGDARFDEPFFGQTLQRRLAVEGARQRLTAFDGLPDRATPPAAIVFHQGRCGSTLLSRMLGVLDGARVFSEPPAIGGLLRHRARLAMPLPRALANLTGAFTRQSAGHEVPRVFIKLPSWCVLFRREFQAAFPETPAFFVFREPSASLASLLTRPAPWLSDPAFLRDIFGAVPAPAENASPGQGAGYCLARILAAAQQGVESGLLPIEHPRLQAFAQHGLPRRLGLEPSIGETAAMAEICRWHAHDPRRAYRPGPSAAVAGSHGDSSNDEVSRLLRDSYDALRKIAWPG